MNLTVFELTVGTSQRDFVKKVNRKWLVSLSELGVLIGIGAYIQDEHLSLRMPLGKYDKL